jgi:phosphoglycerate dehydrogenase-like enzyme
MRTVVFVQQVPERYLEKIRQTIPDWRVVNLGDQEEWGPILSEAEIICGWRPEAAEACLRPASRVKWVQAWGAGVDKMPLNALHRAGIAVTTASGVHPNPVSETVFAMMLAFSRKLHVSVRNQMRKLWQVSGDLGEIHNKTIGIVGVGAIGAEIARLAKAFGMRVLGVRLSGKPADHVDRMFDLGGLATVLKESDFVVASMPLTDRTRHMFSREQFKEMKDTAYFINVSRGATVDTEALVAALRNKEIAGAGLDVFEQEPLPPDHPLWEMDNVIITPHNGGVTDRYHDRATEIFLQNLQSYLQGEEPSLNRVDPFKQY